MTTTTYAAAITDITATVPAIQDRAPTANMMRAYELGRRYAHLHADDAVDEMSDDERGLHDVVMSYRTVEMAYLAGRAGTAMPSWVAGWRYGDAPTDGASRNHIDGTLEAGVSMMAVRVGDAIDMTGDCLSAIFIAAGREIRYYAGWLVTHTYGSDGEPLLVACREIQ